MLDCLTSSHLESGVEPHAVRLKGVDAKRVEVGDSVRKRLLKLEARERCDELLLGKRTHHGRDESEVGRQAGRVAGACS